MIRPLPPLHADPGARSDAVLLLALLAGAVVFVTLRPLGFVHDAESFFAGLRVLSRRPFDLQTPLHVVPAAAAVVLLRLAAPSMRAASTAAIVAGTFVALELSQAAVQFRHARAGDIAAQLVGIAIGLYVKRRVDQIRPGLLTDRALWRRVWVATLLLATGHAAWVGLRAQGGHAIGPLDHSYRISIANEVGGERPWLGTVHGLAMYAAGMNTETAARLAETPIGPGGIAPRAELGPAVVYDFVNAGARVDGAVRIPEQTGLGPEVRWPDAELGVDGLIASGGEMASRKSLGPLTRAIEAAGTVTVEADITPAATIQYGPARIMTISNGPAVRSVTLGQSGDAAVLRVRTRRTGINAANVSVAFPGVFEAGRRVHLLATGTGGRVRIWVDGRFAGERFLLVHPGDWLNLEPAWRDLPASLVLFAPFGLAAAGLARRRLPAAVLGASVALVVAGAIALTAIASGRPVSLPTLIMAPAIALLAAQIAAVRLDRTRITASTG